MAASQRTLLRSNAWILVRVGTRLIIRPWKPHWLLFAVFNVLFVGGLVYLAMLLISILLAYYLSRFITKSLKMIADRLTETSLRNKRPGKAGYYHRYQKSTQS